MSYKHRGRLTLSSLAYLCIFFVEDGAGNEPAAQASTHAPHPHIPAASRFGQDIQTCNPNLDLSFSQLGLQGVPALVDYLNERKHTARDTPSLSRGKPPTPPRDVEVSTEGGDVASPLPVFPHMLNLRECALGDAGLAVLAESAHICGLSGITALSLRQNQLTSAGTRSLFTSLRQSPTNRLTSLALDFNPIGDAGIQPFTAYFKERGAGGGGGMEELSLCFCNFGPVGCRYLSSALLKNSAAATATAAATAAASPTAPASATVLGTHNAEAELAEDGRAAGSLEPEAPGMTAWVGGRDGGVRLLLLAGNHVGDAGARALASALRKNCPLEVLDLTSRCSVGDEGAMALADALRSNTFLRELR
ncbi:unnamed protein product [Discosporangium mesarthrocarpum]